MKIGCELYRYIGRGKIIKYVIFGEIKRQKAKLYEIRSTECTHGWDCELLITKDRHGKLVFVSMLNDDDDCYSDNCQAYWHDTQDGHYFYLTKEEALIGVAKEAIVYWKKEVDKCTKRLETTSKSLGEAEAKLKEYEILLKKKLT